jgi:hypothetical protein
MHVGRRTRREAMAALGGAWGDAVLPRRGDSFLDELERRAVQFFWENSSPQTGLVLDRALASGGETRRVASSAAAGFGLSALCIGAERGWIGREAARGRALATLRHYARQAPHEHGWFYHFVDADTGERVWNCEVSSIDTALLLAGILTARQYFADEEVAGLSDAIYDRVDFWWMLNGHPALLSHGWKPESGFLRNRWDSYCELQILYVLGLASRTSPLPEESWYAWKRPWMQYGPYKYVSGADPLFVHQYSQAWLDFRGKKERRGEPVDWFENSRTATLAHRAFCIELGRERFPGCYSPRLWGITASDSRNGYVAWGGPPPHPAIDGTLVPCAAGGSLMFAREVCLQALESMKARFGDRVWRRYGFVDAFHPLDGWTDPDVIGIDVGITLLSAENARTGSVWRWFMSYEPVRAVMDRLLVPR